MKKSIIITAIAVLVAFVAAFVLVNSYVPVPAGHRAAKDFQGYVYPESYESGPHFTWPFVSFMQVYDVREQKAIYGFSVKEGQFMQDVKISGALNYHLNGDNVHLLYQKVGKDRDYKKVIIDPLVESSVNEIIGKHSSEFVVSQQDMIREAVLYIVRDRLPEANLVDVTDFHFFKPTFTKKYEAAIEEKAVAQQISEKAKYETLRVEEEAKQMKLRFEAEAHGINLKSEAMRNPLIVEYEYAKAFGKWEGKVPSTLMVGQNGVPFVNVK